MNLPKKEELNALRDECYKIACEHGWHDEELSERHFLCLVITELMEAVEADRIDRHADLESLNDAASVYPWVRCFALYVKDTVEGELADAAIRILDLAGVLKWDIGETVEVNLCRDDESLIVRRELQVLDFNSFFLRDALVGQYFVEFGKVFRASPQFVACNE